MPKDNIPRAIKKASGAGGEDFKEGTVEGYGPDGVAVFVEVATDNVNRTVANVRMYFSKYNGSLGKDGCLQFVFNRKGVFAIPAEGIDEDDLTMELIDVGAEDVENDGEVITVYTEMSDFGNVQKKLREMEIEPSSAG